MTGHLSIKGNYKNGIGVAYFEHYTENGQIESHGKWKNGKREGVWVFYRNGRIWRGMSGHYKNGKKGR